MTNPENMTIGQLIRALKPAQLWGLLVLIFGLVSGAATTSYKVSASIKEAEVAKHQIQIDALQSKERNFRGLQTKERFMALYLKYLIAEEEARSNPTEENKHLLREIGDGFTAHIETLLSQGEDAREEIDLTGLYLGKSAGRTATVKFGYDGTVWPLPSEFGFYAAH